MALPAVVLGIGKWWVKQIDDSSNGGWGGPFRQPPRNSILGGVELQRQGSINKVNKSQNLSVSGSGTAKITTINLPGITEGSIPQGSSTVATAVPNISATNFSDPYRQLTPNIYGIYV